MVVLARTGIVVVVTGCGLPFFGFLLCFLLVLFGLRVEVDVASVVVVVVVVGTMESAGTVAMMRIGEGSVCGTMVVVGDGAAVGSGVVVSICVVVGVVVGGVNMVVGA